MLNANDIKVYEETIKELEEEDRKSINVWLKAVEMAVAERKMKHAGHGKANFGRSAAIELLHLRLSETNRNIIG